MISSDDKSPWRNVVKTTRSTSSVLQELECGHHVRVTGDKAWEAKYVTKRRCHDCRPNKSVVFARNLFGSPLP